MIIQFDKNADGFENHIRRDHKLWNYLYFLYSLKKKDPMEYTGIESYVSAQILADDITWIPIGRAAVLQKLDEEKDEVQENINLIQEELTKIENILSKM